MADGDRRSLPAAAPAGLRSRAVPAVLEGRTQAKRRGCSVSTTMRSTAGSDAAGRAAGPGFPSCAAAGRPGEQAALSGSQQQELLALVGETTPDQLGLAGVLGTRDAVAELIIRRSGLLLARTTVGG